MLRRIRIALAVLMFSAVTLLFLDFTGTIHAWLGWTAKVQLLPAVLALNVGVVAVLLVVTLLIGRVYCSVVCPMGVLQDAISWMSGRRKQKKNRFAYSPEKRWLRYGVLVAFVVSLVAGVGSVWALVAPYSAYGRIAANLFAPLYRWGNNVLALVAERMDSYAFYQVDVWMKGISIFVIALLTLVIVGVMAWRSGRTYCNTICPVGTVLGLLSRFSLFRPVIDGEKCKNCSLCARRCKASCIDYQHHQIDYSRCVACMDCIDNCHHGALSLRRRTKKDGATLAASDADRKTTEGEPIDTSRRTFMATTALVATTAAIKAQGKKVDGGLAVIADKQVPQRATRIVPPGAWSARHFAQHCTACQLCVSQCPNDVLRPSSSMEHLMQPEMSYERGYCRPECTRCSEVCPTSAIKPISRADKSSTRIGHAVWIKKNCVVLTDGWECGNCARHCPSGAILMVASDPNDETSPKIPAINTARCIGCGACENLCPARPFSAIYVEGHMVHSTM